MWCGSGMDWSVSGEGQVVRYCGRGNEPSVFIKCGKFYWQAEEILASQDGLCSTDLVC
jgi:hypothetical protein